PGTDHGFLPRGKPWSVPGFSALWWADVAEARLEDAGLAILEVVLERALHHRERELVPGDLALGDELHVEALDSWRPVRIDQPRAEHHVHLADVGDRVDGVEVLDVDLRVSLFHRLARRAFARRLVVLHEARRQRPQSVARLDRALADQDALAIDGKASDHDL